MAADHLLAFLVVSLVVWNQFFIFRLKRAKDSDARLRTYWLTMTSKWFVTVLVLGVMGPRTLWYAHLSTSEERWLPGSVVVAGMTVASVVAMLVPLVVVRKPEGLAALSRQIEKLSFVLPQSSRERFWWVPLSITAGVCEEILFRSFLLDYFHVGPWRVAPGLAIALACAIFGLGHLYQGLKGALAASVLGLLLFVFFLSTGSLLLPILLHALTDLRVLLVLRAVRESAISEPEAC
jgi:membrane protease YdiL (CAAX protease family)